MVYDYIIIGSGFGGSVSAMRLAEKGYSVLVIEKGKQYKTEDFPKTNWNLKKYLWMPKLGLWGIQKLSLFRHAFILSGVGVGGGSLVYANTLMKPPKPFYNDEQWARFADWENILDPFYDDVSFMLGRCKLEDKNEEDAIFQEVAKDLGKEKSFDNVYVGVNFTDEDKEAFDPYFKGLGPKRLGCTKCGGCMVGCRDNAKNTLDKNYLFFAQKFGAEIRSETEVAKIEYKDNQYQIICKSGLLKPKQMFYSKGIIISGGVLGSLKLLLKQKHIYKTLPLLSDKLGECIRTNSESLCSVTLADRKLNNGVAISSIFKPDPDTFIEIVKYPSGSNVMRFLLSMSAGKSKYTWLRFTKLFGNIFIHPIRFVRMIFNTKWADNSIIFLVMQSIDNSMRMLIKRNLFGSYLKLKNDGKKKVPAFIQIGQDVMNLFAKKVNATPQNAITEILFNIPSTAHILGGSPMGESVEDGVIDKDFKVFKYPNMYILDGSIVQGNIGVNPSFTIATLAEYAMNKIPEKKGNTQKTLSELLNNLN